MDGLTRVPVAGEVNDDLTTDATGGADDESYGFRCHLGFDS